ncbi:MAG: DUF99 family protein [Candidatus Thorarchaeota archaeon]
MKDYPITIGIDDAKFKLKSNSTKTYLVGVVCQGTRIVNVLKMPIDIDGDNATRGIIDLVEPNEKHVQYILTETITFGGFNIIDIQEIFKETNKPVIAITERLVNLEGVKEALVKKFPETYKSKFNKILNAGNLYETQILTAGGKSTIYFHVEGLKVSEVEDLLQKLCIDSKLPEPLRLAHIIGTLF